MATILEGFICPICTIDIGDALQLELHFQEQHLSVSSRVGDSVQNIKDIFSKAKKKIDGKLTRDGSSTFYTSNFNQNKWPSEAKDEASFHPVSGINSELWSDSSNPPKRDLYEDFVRWRMKKTDGVATDINKLVIRLEKLMTNLPSDPIKRRNHEKDIVPWLDDEAVKRCPDCTKSFSLTRRKHHCRLCGYVMCHDCTKFVSFELANRLINPATISQYNVPDSLQETDELERNQSQRHLKRSESRESISSLFLSDSVKVAPGFRTCGHCAGMLEKRDSKVELEVGEPPIVVQYYDRLKTMMEEGKAMSQTYLKMNESLRAGEDEYQLDEAKLLRVKIMKMAENIDNLSKRIMTHGTQEGGETPPTTGAALNLQQRIRSAAVNYIKETLVGFGDLPTEAEFESIKKKRVEETSKRVEEEKNSAQLAQSKFEKLHKSGSKGQTQKDRKVKLDDGFVLSPNPNHLDPSATDDPLAQQIAIIESYIVKAINAKRFDEVKALESNLQDLKLAYEQSLSERKELEDNYNSYKHIFKPSSSSSAVEDEFPPDEYDISGKNPFF